MNFLYALGLWTLFISWIPKLLFECFFKKNKKDRFLSRRIFLKYFFKDFSKKMPKNNQFVVWIHAVSVGETKAAMILAKKIKESKKDLFLIISSITKTGHEEAKRSIPFADQYVFLPLDFGFIVNPIIKKIRPNLVIVVETDFWYNFLRLSKQWGAKICLVSGKLSENSLRRFLKFSFFAKKLFSFFDLLICQDEKHKERFLTLGIPEEKLKVTGNLKFDFLPSFLPPEQIEKLEDRFSLKEAEFVLTLASTHEKEEKKLLDTLKVFLENGKKIKIFLVPRHPERFAQVKSLLEKENWPYVSYSAMPKREDKNASLILVDQMGILPSCYQMSHLALVGGSFIKGVGGHNILEPLFYDTPVFFGPFMENQRSMESFVKNHEGGWQLSFNDLEKALHRFFNDKEARNRLLIGGRKVLEEGKGIVEQTWVKIQKILSH